VPLHTLRADIDYGFAESSTTFGRIGVKVWIYQGMVYKTDKNEDAGMLVRKRRDDGRDEGRRDDRRRDGDFRGSEGRAPRPERPARPTDGREGEGDARRRGAETRS